MNQFAGASVNSQYQKHLRTLGQIDLSNRARLVSLLPPQIGTLWLAFGCSRFTLLQRPPASSKLGSLHLLNFSMPLPELLFSCAWCDPWISMVIFWQGLGSSPSHEKGSAWLEHFGPPPLHMSPRSQNQRIQRLTRPYRRFQIDTAHINRQMASNGYIVNNVNNNHLPKAVDLALSASSSFNMVEGNDLGSRKSNLRLLCGRHASK